MKKIFLMMIVLFIILFNTLNVEAKEWKYVVKNTEGSYFIWDEIEGDQDYKNLIIKIEPPVTTEYDHALFNVIFDIKNRKVKILDYSLIRTNLFQGKARAREQMREPYINAYRNSIGKGMPLFVSTDEYRRILFQREQYFNNEMLKRDQDFERNWNENFYATGGIERQIVDSNIFTPIATGSVIERIYEFIR